MELLYAAPNRSFIDSVYRAGKNTLYAAIPNFLLLKCIIAHKSYFLRILLTINIKEAV